MLNCVWMKAIDSFSRRLHLWQEKKSHFRILKKKLFAAFEFKNQIKLSFWDDFFPGPRFVLCCRAWHRARPLLAVQRAYYYILFLDPVKTDKTRAWILHSQLYCALPRFKPFASRTWRFLEVSYLCVSELSWVGYRIRPTCYPVWQFWNRSFCQ